MTVTGPTGATGTGAGAGTGHVIYLRRDVNVGPTYVRSTITGVTTSFVGPTFTTTIPAGTFTPLASVVWSRELANAGFVMDATYTLVTADASGGASLAFAAQGTFTMIYYLDEVGAETASG